MHGRTDLLNSEQLFALEIELSNEQFSLYLNGQNDSMVSKRLQEQNAKHAMTENSFLNQSRYRVKHTCKTYRTAPVLGAF